MKIVFATNNQHKLQEIRDILGDTIQVLSLNDIGCFEDIPETADTLEGNALQKAHYIHDHFGVSCFADDTGLEVECLNGEPGVHSARYAEGTDHDSDANMNKLLLKMEHQNNRKARFRTVIALLLSNNDDQPQCHMFEGIVNGVITRNKSGLEGFGYDPIFQPEGYNKTFAEIGFDVKNQISHRARAVQKLADFLLKM